MMGILAGSELSVQSQLYLLAHVYVRFVSANAGLGKDSTPSQCGMKTFLVNRCIFYISHLTSITMLIFFLVTRCIATNVCWRMVLLNLSVLAFYRSLRSNVVKYPEPWIDSKAM